MRQQSGPHSPLCGAPPHPATPHKAAPANAPAKWSAQSPERRSASPNHSAQSRPRACTSKVVRTPRSEPKAILCAALRHTQPPRKKPPSRMRQQSGPLSPLSGAPPHPATPQKPPPPPRTRHPQKAPLPTKRAKRNPLHGPGNHRKPRQPPQTIANFPPLPSRHRQLPTLPPLPFPCHPNTSPLG